MLPVDLGVVVAQKVTGLKIKLNQIGRVNLVKSLNQYLKFAEQ